MAIGGGRELGAETETDRFGTIKIGIETVSFVFLFKKINKNNKKWIYLWM